MWKPEHRRAAARSGLRYPSGLTDAEWAIVGPMIPPARHGGRRRSVNAREVLNGIFYVLSTGCQWQALPKDLPLKSTVHHYFMLWDWDGTLERIHHALYVAAREQAEREATPTTAIIDSQSAKGALPQLSGLRFCPKHWIVERTFAWISRFRHMVRDFERYARTVAAFIRIAMIRIMLRRLTKSCHSI